LQTLFCLINERVFLPPMPPDKRKFVHDLASVYRMDTQMMDREPYRSVQLIRRVDTRVPTPLLSTFITPALGKLADFRTVKGTTTTATINNNASPQPSHQTTAPSTSHFWNTPTMTATTVPAQRGWTSVVAASAGSSSSSLAVPKPEVVVPGSTVVVGSSSVSRTASPAHFGTSSGPVPDNWEDDDV